MFIGSSHRPLSALEELELRRDRLLELITLGLVSASLKQQIIKAIEQLDAQIVVARAPFSEGFAPGLAA